MSIGFKERFYFAMFKNYFDKIGRPNQNSEKIKAKISKCTEVLGNSSDFLYELYKNGRPKHKIQNRYYRNYFYRLLSRCENQDKVIELLSKKIVEEKSNNIEEMLDICLGEGIDSRETNEIIFSKVLEAKLKYSGISQEEMERITNYFFKFDAPETVYDICNYVNILSDFVLNNLSSELQDTYKQNGIKNIIDKIEDKGLNEQQLKIVNGMLERRINRQILSLSDAYYMLHHGKEYFLSFARMGDETLDFLLEEQIENINVKSIGQILKNASEKYGALGDEFKKNLVSSYIIFGKQKTMDLINNKYGEMDLETFHSFFDGMNTDGYAIDKNSGESIYNDCQVKLINFLFASGPNDPNANIKKVISNEISRDELPINTLVNEWKLYYEFLEGAIDLKNVMEQMNKLDIELKPNLYEIAPILKMSGISSYYDVKDSFEKMSNRINSSIPKVEGAIGDLEYEVLDMNDPMQMSVGYKTHCCFTFGGASESALKDACSSDSSRIFVLKKNGNIVAQSWMWRNGNTVCFDNIEVVGIDKSGERSKNYYHAYEAAAQDILEISRKNETEPIEAVTVGLSYTKIDLPGEKLTGKVLLPEAGIYTDAMEQIMIAKTDDYEAPNGYRAQPIYQDTRKKISYIDPQQSQFYEIEKIEQHVNKINYSVSPEKYRPVNCANEYTFVTKGQDWYIGITNNGNVVAQSHSVDPRCNDEMKNQLNIIQTKITEGKLQEYLNDALSNRTMVMEGVKNNGKQ